MYHYLIANAPSDSWIVVSSPEPDGFQPDVAHALSTTLGGVCLAFEGIFGKNVLFRYPRLTVRNSPCKGDGVGQGSGGAVQPQGQGGE